MSEKCKYAYRQRGKAAVCCRQIKGDMPFCGHSYFCHVSGRWEANKAVRCTLREKPPIQD